MTRWRYREYTLHYRLTMRFIDKFRLIPKHQVIFAGILGILSGIYIFKETAQKLGETVSVREIKEAEKTKETKLDL